jgi:cytochrome c oxidase assembly protein subunit 11
MMEKRAPSPVVIDPRRNKRVAGYATGAFLFMLGASFAAVPLYDLFCRTTGYGGTPMIAKSAPTSVSERVFTVRFDANVAAGLGWKFTPEVESVTLKAGEVKTVGYTVKNLKNEPITAIASYNVTPAQVGAWFNKLACFCFTDVTLQPGEEKKEEVVFYIDPAISQEPVLDVIKTITLSYTFFPAKNPSKPLADAGNAIPAREPTRATTSK